MLFEVEMTVEVTGICRVEAENAEAARALAGKATVVSVDVMWLNSPFIDGDLMKDQMFDETVEAVYEVEEEPEKPVDA